MEPGAEIPRYPGAGDLVLRADPVAENPRYPGMEFIRSLGWNQELKFHVIRILNAKILGVEPGAEIPILNCS